MMFFTSNFLKFFASIGSALKVVNISSLAAVKAFETWGIYCTNKAARDMFIRVIAEENKGNKVKALNYAPGPMDTGILKNILLFIH